MKATSWRQGKVLAWGLASMLAAILPTRISHAGPAYAVFGNTGVTVGNSQINGGLLGSNTGLVTVGPSSNFVNGLAGGGDLTYTSTGGGIVVGGPVTFAGNASLGIFDTINGPVNVGGNLSFGSSPTLNAPVTVGGSFSASFSAINTNLKAGADVNLTTSFDKVTGNVVANGNATIKGIVTGNVTYGGTLTTGPFTQIGSSTHGTAPVAPAPFVPETLPKADVFTAGGADVTNGGSAAAPIAPGSYGTLNVTWPGNIYLTAGDYYFNAVNLFGSQDFHFVNLTGGNKTRIFVTGDIHLGSLMNTYVNEQSFDKVDPAAGANVLWETLGNFTIDPLSADNLVGTLFAPNGNISLGQYAQIDGAVIAGGTVTASSGLVVNYATLPTTGAYLVPEPASVSLLALGTLMFLRRKASAK